jgi:hypothetical protein
MQTTSFRYSLVLRLLLLFWVGFVVTADAQRLQPGERMAQMQGLKIEFINRYLKLTQADSGFWRVYYPYVAEIKRAKFTNTDDVIEAEEKILAIRKKYQPEFRRILGSEERAQKVYTIDREFAKLAREEMQKRAGRRFQQE